MRINFYNKNYYFIKMEIESQKLRQVTLCIQYQDSIIVKVDQKSLPFFKYNPNFDPWDNLAAARYLYEHI